LSGKAVEKIEIIHPNKEYEVLKTVLLRFAQNLTSPPCHLQALKPLNNSEKTLGLLLLFAPNLH
jgi:hypothetical protein